MSECTWRLVTKRPLETRSWTRSWRLTQVPLPRFRAAHVEPVQKHRRNNNDGLTLRKIGAFVATSPFLPAFVAFFLVFFSESPEIDMESGGAMVIVAIILVQGFVVRGHVCVLLRIMNLFCALATSINLENALPAWSDQDSHSSAVLEFESREFVVLHLDLLVS